MKNKGKYIIFVIIGIIAVIISSFNLIIDFVTDYKWMEEVGYTRTFLTKILSQIKIFLPGFLIIFLIVFLYSKNIKKKYYKHGNINPKQKGERLLDALLGLAATIIALYIANIFASRLWFDILQLINRKAFNINDPIFNNDLSFYVFVLPFVKEVLSLLLLLVFTITILSIVLYIVLFTFRRPQQNVFNAGDPFDLGDRVKQIKIKDIIDKELLKESTMQIGVLALLFFILLAISFYLNTFDLLYSSTGVAFGAGYTDVNIRVWVYRILAIGTIISGILVLRGIIKNNVKQIVLGPLLIIVIALIGSVSSGLVQRFIISPNEISREQEYIEYNIDFTQKAYGLDEVEEREFPVSNELTKEDLRNNQETINNIRINDYRPITQVYNQLQAIRLYYTFSDVDIDRYMIDGQYTQVFLSARELDQSNLQTKTWMNKHLKYTHGYGLALSPVNKVTAEGQPELLIRSIPPQTSTDLVINRPEIYFGETTNDYILVKTDEKEFDYPFESDNMETIYEGEAGVELRGINRLLYSIKQRSFRMLVSSNINPDSRIVMYRNINERVRKIAPFLVYDDNPYIVINQEDGRLYWIIDAYTISDKYPYASPYSENGNINYVKNSVKVVIDAYNGDVDFYIFDENDPIIQTYNDIFPDLLKNKSEMPEGLISHTRYPTNLFNIQAEIYRTYHVNNPRVFYNEEDLWDIAKEKYIGGEQEVEPIYQMFKLPEEDNIEILLTIPYTPKQKPNMTSLLVARNDGENYGKLFNFVFPKGETVDGPMMIESRIDQNTEISEQLTLWGQLGSTVLRGNVIIVPIENSLLYVEPIYLQADNVNSFPEMKRVVVSFKENLVIDNTLEGALGKIFGTIDDETPGPGEDVEGPQEPDIEITPEIQDLIKEANDLFNKAKEASQEGNWAEYGRYIEELEKVLEQLNEDINSSSHPE